MNMQNRSACWYVVIGLLAAPILEGLDLAYTTRHRQFQSML